MAAAFSLYYYVPEKRVIIDDLAAAFCQRQLYRQKKWRTKGLNAALLSWRQGPASRLILAKMLEKKLLV
jgi:hypothetical protein